MTDTSETTGIITDEGIARMRERIGVVVPQPGPFNEFATIDGFRHFANGYGDDNPLYCDQPYAHGTRWEGPIAPPLFLMTMGTSEVKELRPELRARGAHALAGVHEFLAGDEWEWFLPVRPGDRMTKRYYLYDVEEKSRSAFTGSRSVITRYRADFVNQDGKLVAADRFKYVRAERSASAQTKKYDFVNPGYTDEDLSAFDEAYASEQRRGANTLYWEDVEVGALIPTLVKGPLTLTDVIVWMRGWGGGVHTGRLAWQHRRRHPGFYSKNSLGAWDVVERVHWEEAWAKSIGNPYPYDFGRMRQAYLSQAITNWAGDDAWLWKLSAEFRRFNFAGDVTWVKGRIVEKSVKAERRIVRVEVWCENQQGEITAPGSATVILPSRRFGQVKLPRPSPEDQSITLLY